MKSFLSDLLCSQPVHKTRDLVLRKVVKKNSSLTWRFHRLGIINFCLIRLDGADNNFLCLRRLLKRRLRIILIFLTEISVLTISEYENTFTPHKAVLRTVLDRGSLTAKACLAYCHFSIFQICWSCCFCLASDYYKKRNYLAPMNEWVK